MSGTGAFFKYPPNHQFEGKKVLNAGCGYEQFLAPNVTNVDAYGICDPDLVWDLNVTPLPFPDEHFDFILLNHIVEHIENWWAFFVDCARMLKPGGMIEVWVPGDGSDSIFGYRDHVHMINHCSFFGTFENYRYGGNAFADATADTPAVRLKFVHAGYRAENKWWIRYAPTSLKNWFRHHLRNVVAEQQFLFRKVTDAEWAVEQNRLQQRRDKMGAHYKDMKKFIDRRKIV